jgi:hypothetical protein
LELVLVYRFLFLFCRSLLGDDLADTPTQRKKAAEKSDSALKRKRTESISVCYRFRFLAFSSSFSSFSSSLQCWTCFLILTQTTAPISEPSIEEEPVSETKPTNKKRATSNNNLTNNNASPKSAANAKKGGRARLATTEEAPRVAIKQEQIGGFMPHIIDQENYSTRTRDELSDKPRRSMRQTPLKEGV